MRQQRRAANVQKMTRRVPNVELRIDELILRGFAAADRYAIGDALTFELGKLLGQGESNLSLSADADIPAINAGQIAIPPNVRPEAVGAQVAQAVHASLNGSQMGGRR